MKTLLVVSVTMAFFICDFSFAADADLLVDAPTSAAASPEIDQAFLIYLETPEIPAERVQHYLAGLDECSRLLKNRDEAGAQKILVDLAHDVQLDHGLCDELNRRIDATNAVLAQKESVDKSNAELKSSLDKVDANPDDMTDALRKQSEEQRDKSSPADSPDNPTGARLTENYLKDTQTQEQIAANEKNYRTLVDQCRGDFLNYIEELTKDGHYRLALLAVQSYQLLFPNGGDTPEIHSVMANCRDKLSALKEMIIASQEEGSKRQLVAASDQLKAAYRLGADDPSILGIALALKKPILVFILQEVRLRAAMQAADLGACAILLSEMSREAVDFNAFPVQKFVDGLRAKSQLLINQAESEIKHGNTASGLEAFQKAATVWPGNPALQKDTVDLVLRQEAKAESLKKFDDYSAQEDYASLAAQSQEFAPWLEGDPRREAALKEAQEKVHAADNAIRQAADLQAAGQGAAAWETLAYAASVWPSNRRLNELKVALASGAPNFVQAIDQAQEAEKRSDLGLSLSWYAVARSCNAQSRLAREGIDRVANKILN